MKILTAFSPSVEYTEKQVERLADQVKKYSGIDLTVVEGQYPSWWCKMNIFQVEGPCLFMDLDTTIVDDLSPLLKLTEKKRFVGLRNFNKMERFASCVMSWNGDMSHIYEDFAQDPEGYMSNYPTGDQDFIHDGGYSPEYYQDLVPNRVHSYKKYVREHGIHKRCCVVAFHGTPRPWTIPELSK